MGIYEMLRMTTALKELVRKKAGEAALRRSAIASGTTTLLEDGLTKVREGVTNPEELLRVVELEADDSFPCPKCTALVTREFKTCPYCMSILRNICGSCGQDLKPEWKMCPYCTTPVSVPVVPVEPPKALSEAKEDPAPARAEAHLLPQQSAAAPPVKKPKILIADDDKGITTVIRKALEQLPMDVEVFTAADGVEALDSMEAHRADLVVLDVNMPRMDGFAVCDRLRKDIRTAFLPILMLTANNDQDARTKGYLVGTDDYMSKPFAVPDLVARVTRLLRRTYGL
jgi:CheY-like chemotaxis protein/RNA polymerase subunit RPABC4/transcription elongation factor Spt4